MDAQLKLSRQSAQKRYNAKIKDQLVFCYDCKTQVRKPTWRFHIKSKKHLQNTFKQRKSFFEEYMDIHKQLSIEGLDIRNLFIKIHDLIEAEYYEDGVEFIPEEERYTDPLPFALNDVERECCGTVGWMEQKIDSLLTVLHRNRPHHVSVDYLEKKESAFNRIRANVDDKDLKKKLLRCFQDLNMPWPADKTEEEEQKKIEKWRKQEKEHEEKMRQRSEAYSGSKPSHAVVAAHEENEEGLDLSDPFPAFSAFLKMNDEKKHAVLENIAFNYLHIFDRPMEDFFDIVENKKTGDYNEAYQFALSQHYTYIERQQEEEQEEQEDGMVMDMDMDDDNEQDDIMELLDNE